MAGATVISIVYGIDVNTSDGASYFEAVELALQVLSQTAHKGYFLGTWSYLR